MKTSILATAILSATLSLSAVAEVSIPTDPSDGDLEPIGDITTPHYRTVADKVNLFNEVMANKGKNAHIILVEGVATLVFTDGQGNEILRDIDVSDIAEITARKSAIAERVKSGLPSLDPIIELPGQPSDGDLEPIGDITTPHYRTVADKVNLFNEVMANKGKNAHIIQGEGVATLVFTDGQGNEILRDIDVNDIAEITARKSAIAERIKSGLPSVDPIEPVLGDPSNDFGGGGDLIGNPVTPAPIEDFPIVTPGLSDKIVARLQEEGAEFKELRDQMLVLRDDLKKQSEINNQGSSISIAISTIPQAMNGGNMIGVGVAQFEGETSIAIGASTNFGLKNQHTVNFNLGKAKDTSSASVGYGFAF